MAYQTRMLFRMCAPALGVMALAMVFAVVVTAIGDLPALLGAQPEWPGLGNAIALTGLGVSLVLCAVQLIRYRRRPAQGWLCHCR